MQPERAYCAQRIEVRRIKYPLDALDILPGDCNTPIPFSLIIILKALFKTSVCKEHFHASTGSERFGKSVLSILYIDFSYGPSSQICAGDRAGNG